MRHTLGKFLCTVACLGVMVTAGRVGATSFTIDSSQSSLNAGAYLGGPPGAGGGTLITLSQNLLIDTTTTSLSGNVLANISGGNISFPGGGVVNFATQPINLLPDANGGDVTGPDPANTGGAPGQYGLMIDTTLINIPGYIAISGATADISDFAGATPLTAGTFDATQQNVSIPAANAAYWLDLTQIGLGPVTFGASVLAPPTLIAQNGVDSQGNAYPLIGTVTTVGPVTTLTIPIFADQAVLVNGIPLDIVFTGTIVATSVVPEPSTIVLVGIGMIALVPAVRRRLRKA